jgi:hypothetical protein
LASFSPQSSIKLYCLIGSAQNVILAFEKFVGQKRGVT